MSKRYPHQKPHYDEDGNSCICTCIHCVGNYIELKDGKYIWRKKCICKRCDTLCPSDRLWVPGNQVGLELVEAVEISADMQLTVVGGDGVPLLQQEQPFIPGMTLNVPVTDSVDGRVVLLIQLTRRK